MTRIRRQTFPLVGAAAPWAEGSWALAVRGGSPLEAHVDEAEEGLQTLMTLEPT